MVMLGSGWDGNIFLVRARSGSIFSYYGQGRFWSMNTNYIYGDGMSDKSWSTRAVVVVGSGI